MMTTLSTTHCAIENCQTTILNKPAGVSFHPCPTNNEMRKHWLKLLKNKCSMLDWQKSQICSKHFESKYFDSQRKLRDNAVPTIFGHIIPKSVPKPAAKPQNKYPKPTHTQPLGTPGLKGYLPRVPWNLTSTSELNQVIEPPRSKVDRLLKKLTQAELTAHIKSSMSKMKEPNDLDNYVTDDLRCRQDTPKEAQLWLMVKKQDHLNNRLMDLVVQTKKHVEILQHNAEEAKITKRDNEQAIESLKYIVKCLQEKHATLEEQIEILTSVESR